MKRFFCALFALCLSMICATAFAAPAGYTAAFTADGDMTITQDILSAGINESALLVTGGDVTLTGATVTRRSDEASAENAAAGGEGAAILITGGMLTVDGASVTTDAEGSVGIYCRGNGAVYISDSALMTARFGSPALYIASDATATETMLTAMASSALVVEGTGSVSLYNCAVTGGVPESRAAVFCHGAVNGTGLDEGSIEMVGGKLSGLGSGLFCFDHTVSSLYLDSVEIQTDHDCPFFLFASGSTRCDFTANSQVMRGNVILDGASLLEMTLTGASALTGAIICQDAEADERSICNVTIDEQSIWTVTGDSHVTSLTCAGGLVDGDGLTVSVVDIHGTVCVQGTSPYTVTVESYE